MDYGAIQNMVTVAHVLFGLHDPAALLLQHPDQRYQTLKAQHYFHRLPADSDE